MAKVPPFKGWYATREHVTTKTVWAELRESGAA
jgi:hypothetical protein